MPDRLTRYRAKRDAARTPEPVPAGAAGLEPGDGNSFVVQEHHARALHWDFRLERDGVLVSWAVPKGLPVDPKTNHLAVQTEDHPLEYAQFEGTIPAGEYGGGEVTIWDSGSYLAEKWTDREVKFTLSGQRVSGRFVLIRTGGKNWLMHRMDDGSTPPPARMPDRIAPMMAVLSELPAPAEDDKWAYETKWDGARAVALIDGGRIRLISRNDRDITVSYPELRELGERVGSRRLILDGEIVAFGTDGRPSFARLQKRMHVDRPAEARRLSQSDPVVYLLFDLLYLDGSQTIELPYSERRRLLADLELTGPSWQTPPHYVGGGAEVLRANAELGMEGIVAKRVTSRYQPGRRSPDWRKIKNVRTQEVVLVGWKPGNGRRAGTIGSLLLAIPDGDALVYAGKVGTGFTDAALAALLRRLTPLARKSSPLAGEPPRAEVAQAQWISPRLVGEVGFAEWTGDGRLRHPVWRGLRPDKDPADVVREG